MRYACLEGLKAYQQGAPVHIHVDDPEAAAELDELMWDYPKHRFLPHEIIDPDSKPTSPVQIGYHPPHHQEGVLINLSTEVPSFFGRFDRVVEIIVGETRTEGRSRYSHYRDRGYPLHHHAITDWEGASE